MEQGFSNVDENTSTGGANRTHHNMEQQEQSYLSMSLSLGDDDDDDDNNDDDINDDINNSNEDSPFQEHYRLHNHGSEATETLSVIFSNHDGGTATAADVQGEEFNAFSVSSLPSTRLSDLLSDKEGLFLQRRNYGSIMNMVHTTNNNRNTTTTAAGATAGATATRRNEEEESDASSSSQSMSSLSSFACNNHSPTENMASSVQQQKKHRSCCRRRRRGGERKNRRQQQDWIRNVYSRTDTTRTCNSSILHHFNNDDDDNHDDHSKIKAASVAAVGVMVKNGIETLPSAVLLQCLQFLDFDSLKNCMRVNRYCRDVLLSTDVHWKELCKATWPHIFSSFTIGEQQHHQQQQQLTIVNDLDPPTLQRIDTCRARDQTSSSPPAASAAAAARTTTCVDSLETSCCRHVNYPQLLTWAAAEQPTAVNEELFADATEDDSRRFWRWLVEEVLPAADPGMLRIPRFEQQRFNEQPQVPTLEMVQVHGADNSNSNSGRGGGTNVPTMTTTTTTTTTTAVRFNGRVNAGNRCIRANAPLPRPALTTRLVGIRLEDESDDSILDAASSRMIMMNDDDCADDGTDEDSMSSSFEGSESSSSCFTTSTTTSERYSYAARQCPKSKQQQRQRQHVSVTRWKPFVSPYLDAKNQVHLTPRCISYFEVSILSPTAAIGTNAAATDSSSLVRVTNDNDNNDDHRHHHPLRMHQQPQQDHFGIRDTTRHVRDCVAVGICRSHFPLQHFMPGWDGYSYGYHGDDGGFFHGSGHARRDHYGPMFAVGDTVGCGIHYYSKNHQQQQQQQQVGEWQYPQQRARIPTTVQTARLFYTLNGAWLGYAAELPFYNALEDWYPVVGIDTTALVQCNFTGPFQFDLTDLILKHSGDE